MLINENNLFVFVAVKRSYRKASLQCHPDRVSSSEKENATRKFQVLGKVYSILSDKEKRAVYDESGNGILSRRSGFL